MDSRNLRWASVGAAFAVFAIADLLILLLLPAHWRGAALALPPLLSGIIAVIAMGPLLAVFERQEAWLERQRREIETLHAMDTAITAEMELPLVLERAAEQANRVLDAELSGILLTDGDGDPVEETFHHVPDDQRDAFRAVLQGENDDSLEVARAPLMRAGETLGVIAVAKRRPCAPFGSEGRYLLRALAGTTVVAITNARSLATVRSAAVTEAKLRRESRIVAALQEGLLPEIPTEIGPFRFAKHYQAQSDEAQVGGDIYDLFQLGADSDRRFGVVIADVSGKGLAAARKTAMVKYALRSYAREHASPGAVLTRLNDALFDEPDLTGFVTLFYGVLSGDGDLRYASAGHETPLLLRAGTDDCEMLKPTGLVLGAVRDQEYDEGCVTLQPGDGLLLYTDGLSEARSPGGEFLDVPGLIERLKECRADAPADMADAILQRVQAWSDGRRSDDTAILWIERVPAKTA